MDFAVSEFPSEQSSDELLQFFSISGQQDSSNQKKHEQNSIPSEDGINVVSKKHEKKKIIHKDIERQRRQEMKTLYVTLRSLLPLEYLKGKRSISDHMHGAVKYIKRLQNRIRELTDKKDELKRSLSSLHTPSSTPEIRSPDCSEDSVVVRSCFVGLEVAIDTGFKRGLPLSSVLGVIVAQGLSVVTCISTKVNERVLHTIVLEVIDGRSIELSDLKQKLTKLIIHSPSS